MIERQAILVARWLLVGFIHGVMNTDNMSVAGETIDYGPCAFMDAYDPATVFSSIDHYGRYAYSNQPSIAQWNLARLAECLIPLLADDQDEALEQAKEALSAFADHFNSAYIDGLRRKLGLTMRAGRRCRPFAGSPRSDGRQQGRLHADLPETLRGRLKLRGR